MKIVGSSKQDGIPSPDNPVEIKNETVLIITDKEGNKKEMPFKYEKILKEGDKIEKINGEWCLVRRKPMNDIEILEDIISEYKATAIEWKFGNVPVHLDERDIEAIENLIQRNKDLEQIEQEHKEENGRLREEVKKLKKIDLSNSKIIANMSERHFQDREKIRKFEKTILLESKPTILGMIPISRIKEKIEELTKIKGDLATHIATSERIKVLQELLEESEK